jgi:predicted mannosyl-3-phosphoglycerate phosphatase (HAD superfamily)
MANLTTTNSELVAFRQAAQRYIQTHPERSKFHYALERTLKKTLPALEDWADQENDIRVDTAVQENGKLVYMDVGSPMRPEKMLVVQPDKAKELQKRLRELGRKTVSVEVHYCPTKDIPADLPAAYFQEFVGWVIEKDPCAIEEEDAELKIV